MGFLGMGGKKPGSPEDVPEDVRGLRKEVQGLLSLVNSQNARIAALEAKLGTQPSAKPSAAVSISSQAKTKRLPQTPSPPSKKPAVDTLASAEPPSEGEAMVSPHLKVVGKAQLDAPLASAALSVYLPASKGSQVPKYAAAADVAGRIHLLDSVGRPMAPVVEPPPDASGAPLALAFGTKEPAVLYVAADEASTPPSFSLRQYRLLGEVARRPHEPASPPRQRHRRPAGARHTRPPPLCDPPAPVTTHAPVLYSAPFPPPAPRSNGRSRGSACASRWPRTTP